MATVEDDSINPNGDHGQRFEPLLDALPVGRLSVDRENIIRQWSKGAAAIFGWDAHEVMGQPLHKLVDWNRVSENTGGSVQEQEVETTRKSGEPVELKLLHLADSVDETLILAEDITEQKFLERALLEATEREQRRIGQELHDHLCQHLLGAAFAAKALAGALERDGSNHASALHDLARLINDSVTQARDISRGLHPVELDSAGLMSALQELATRASHSIRCDFHCKKNILVENSIAARNAYRIAQEAVTTAIQQSGASHITLTLSKKNDSICLEILDNGKSEGELTKEPYGTAVRTLRYRAQAMRGEVHFHFEPGRGTRVICTFPNPHE
ncbi:hypothetical protein TSACC_22325 [Terrimicrobium sacchariphilum]|jgi:PAS domain S-box-containing protein|uniref:PAS domain-containing protein n=1 Tax=Terrimicrobium sacchariphilum TaxID=690879 RepID=A0A146GAP9_TERSA|nr:histidine kinase [Terrimicrobium sacchariphilum]GAT33904.1 hypothetical protein TSACC_22325 [Terrimicrobium sacchariphilum]